MTASGQEARTPPGATPAGGGGPARRSRTSSLDNRAIMLRIGLAGAIHMLRSRRFYERVIVGAIGAAALARVAKENQASTFARLQAWDKRQVQRIERKAKSAARQVSG